MEELLPIEVKEWLRKIEELTTIPKSTICDVLKRYNERGTNERKNGSGGPLILNTDDIKKIHRENFKMSSTRMNKIFEKRVIRRFQ